MKMNIDELSSGNASFIISSMEQKTLLITGATGFLAKVFIEKVLRIQPQVKKIYILLRAKDTTAATHRFQQEVIGKEVFNVLREIHGSKGFDSFISSKVVPLAGDISLEDLGITYSELEQEMLKEINFIVNVAANCDYEERYDVALSINTLGVKHIFEFAKKCQNLESFLHVSTAYVTREREGRILEKLPYAFRKGETFSGRSSAKHDIEKELRIAEQRLKQLLEEKATGKITTISMKALGLQRARFHGWTNTYVFTKAMGEFLLAQLKKENYAVPVVILRPTDITCTYKQPFPGWSEGFKGVDAVVDTYGKGNLTHFVADPHSILDVIPGDMVANSIMVALAAHQDDIIYQVGSSTRNPMKIHDLMNWASDYYSMNPNLDRNGKPIRISRLIPLPSMAMYSEFVKKHYKLPLEALRAGNCLSSNKSFQHLYNKLNKQYMSLTRLVELFGPFTLFKGRFDNSNSEKLRAIVKEEELKEFEFDTKGIDWEDYFKNVHFPGITKYASTKSRLPATSSRL